MPNFLITKDWCNIIYFTEPSDYYVISMFLPNLDLFQNLKLSHMIKVSSFLFIHLLFLVSNYLAIFPWTPSNLLGNWLFLPLAFKLGSRNIRALFLGQDVLFCPLCKSCDLHGCILVKLCLLTLKFYNFYMSREIASFFDY